MGVLGKRRKMDLNTLARTCTLVNWIVIPNTSLEQSQKVLGIVTRRYMLENIVVKHVTGVIIIITKESMPICMEKVVMMIMMIMMIITRLVEREERRREEKRREEKRREEKGKE